MEYRVEINPAKEREFIQLLQAWESLGVVMHYEPLMEDASDAPGAGYDPPRHARKKTADPAWEMAEPYKDLLD
ncbi:MAG: hypothetical protein KF852_13015 [Saprospiraceae bacterium]|nr:hypothetical protein [Saprospiraceae bacterium]